MDKNLKKLKSMMPKLKDDKLMIYYLESLIKKYKETGNSKLVEDGMGIILHARSEVTKH